MRSRSSLFAAFFVLGVLLLVLALIVRVFGGWLGFWLVILIGVALCISDAIMSRRDAAYRS